MPTSHRILKLQGAQKHNDNAKEEVVQKQALTKGSFCEFEEKKRHHVGKIVESEHVGSGNVRYTVRFVAPFEGLMMVHCHIQKHSEFGMMALARVTDARCPIVLAS